VFGGHDRLIRQSLRQKFLVTLADGAGEFSGVLIDADDTHFVYADVRIPGNGGTAPAAGQTFVDRINVAYQQKLTLADRE